MITFITFNQLHINLYNFLVKHGNILKLPWFWTGNHCFGVCFIKYYPDLKQ